MRVLYHRGENIGAETIVKEGVIDEKSRPLILVGEDRIVFDAIHAVDFYRLNTLGTMIKVQNRLKSYSGG